MTIPDPRPVRMPASQAGQLHDLLTIYEHMLAWLRDYGDPDTLERLEEWTRRLTSDDTGRLQGKAAAASAGLASALTGRSYQ